MLRTIELTFAMPLWGFGAWRPVRRRRKITRAEVVLTGDAYQREQGITSGIR
jgi:hypothetical protein